jgi:death on curing protein
VVSQGAVKKTLYPTLDEVLFLHERLLARFGGAPGVRDLGLVESALARPRSGYYGSLTEQAAALLQSLATNHPFIDGNKRVAFAATAVFLRINCFRVRVDPEAAERFLIERVIGGRAPLGEIATFLEGALERAD